MGRRLTFSTLAAAFVLYGATNAQAASVTFDLNCVWSGSGNNSTCTPTTSFGTVTLTDSTVNSNWIEILVSLTNGGDLGRLYLNYDLTGPTSQSGWSWGGNDIDSVSLDGNDVGPGDYDYLDISISPEDGDSYWSSTLFFKRNGQNQYQNLDVSMFNLLSPGSGTNGFGSNTPVWTGASVDNWCTRYNTSGTRCYDTNDFRVGSLGNGWSSDPQDQQPLPTPEPSTLALMGAGLLGAARSLRSKLKAGRG